MTYAPGQVYWVKTKQRGERLMVLVRAYRGRLTFLGIGDTVIERLSNREAGRYARPALDANRRRCARIVERVRRQRKRLKLDHPASTMKAATIALRG